MRGGSSSLVFNLLMVNHGGRDRLSQEIGSQSLGSWELWGRGRHPHFVSRGVYITSWDHNPEGATGQGILGTSLRRANTGGHGALVEDKS